MKKAILILSVLSACVMLSSCGGSESSAAASKEESAAETVVPEGLKGLSCSEEAVKLSEYMMDGKYDSVNAAFTEDLAGKMPAGDLQVYWEVLLAEAGTYNGHIDTMTSEESGKNVSDCVLDYSAKDIVLSYVFEEDGRVSTFWLDLQDNA